MGTYPCVGDAYAGLELRRVSQQTPELEKLETLYTAPHTLKLVTNPVYASFCSPELSCTRNSPHRKSHKYPVPPSHLPSSFHITSEQEIPYKLSTSLYHSFTHPTASLCHHTVSLPSNGIPLPPNLIPTFPFHHVVQHNHGTEKGAFQHQHPQAPLPHQPLPSKLHLRPPPKKQPHNNDSSTILQIPLPYRPFRLPRHLRHGRQRGRTDSTRMLSLCTQEEGGEEGGYGGYDGAATAVS